MNDPLKELEERVLVQAPTARDAATCCEILRASGIACFLCDSLAGVCEEARRGAGMAVVTAEAVIADTQGSLAEFLHTQPNWSDFPVIVLTPSDPDSPRLLQALSAVGHTTLMKRPVGVATLLSAVQTALRDRMRQYALRKHLAEERLAAEALREEIRVRKKVEAVLKETDRRKDDFIALLAHELRNPLAPIRNSLQIMQLAENDKAAISKSRAIMDRQLGHMVRLIDDLLDVSRISRNKMELRRSRVLLTEVISNAVETAQPQIELGGHEFSVVLPADLIYLDADLTRLAQVFSNLLTNSAKYTERGGKISLVAEIRSGEVFVSIRDNGIGIPAESLSTIFDMFSQVDRSVERTTGGLGIGLALVRGLVEMHGGAVTATSEGVGKGSTFTVRLPTLGSRRDIGGGDSTPHTPQRGAPCRILAVDDNRDSAASLAMMLRFLGNQVETAHDGQDAIDVADRFRPEVILMDMGMPRMNGLDAVRQIRSRPWGVGIIIIALTGWGQDGDRQRSADAGCDGHLVKPVSLSDLQYLLHQTTACR